LKELEKDSTNRIAGCNLIVGVDYAAFTLYNGELFLEKTNLSVVQTA